MLDGRVIQSNSVTRACVGRWVQGAHDILRWLICGFRDRVFVVNDGGYNLIMTYIYINSNTCVM